MTDMFLRAAALSTPAPVPQPPPKPAPPGLRIGRLDRLAAIQRQRPPDQLFAAPPMPESPHIRPTLGRFRPTFIAKPTGRVGVGILTFHSRAEAQKAVESVKKHAKPNYTILLFDNSENEDTAEWAMGQKGLHYIRSPYNTGCGQARNRMAEFFASAGCEHFIVQDQDVVWAGDAAASMLDVFGQYAKTGCVTWKLAVTTMGHQRLDRWDATGKLNPPETPGMCCMYSVAALADDLVRRGNGVGRHDADLVGWYPGYGLCYRFDTDVCLAMWSKGFDTRVVVKGDCKVRHEHPHRGVTRLGPALHTERAFSDKVLRARAAKYGWHWMI